MKRRRWSGKVVGDKLIKRVSERNRLLVIDGWAVSVDQARRAMADGAVTLEIVIRDNGVTLRVALADLLEHGHRFQLAGYESQVGLPESAFERIDPAQGSLL